MKSKVTVIILIVIIVFLGALSFFFGYKFLNSAEKINELIAQVESLTNENQEIQTQLGQGGEADGTQNEVQTVEKLIIPKFDYEKGSTYNGENLSYDGYTCYTDTGYCYVKENTANFSSNSNEEYTYTIDENVVDAVRTWIGQGSNIATCLLGESGNVYINLLGNNGDNMTKIDSVSNICRLFVTTLTDGQGRQLRTIVGVDTDGNNHDICTIYNNTITRIW